MNESIDIIFMGSKLATKDEKSTSLAVHAFSAGYNIAQMAHYRYAYSIGKMSLSCGGSRSDLATVEQCRREMIKHTVLAAIDVGVLLIMGLTSFKRDW